MGHCCKPGMEEQDPSKKEACCAEGEKCEHGEKECCDAEGGCCEEGDESCCGEGCEHEPEEKK